MHSPWVNNFITEDRLVEVSKMIQVGTKLPVTFCEEYQYWVKGLDKLANQLDFISLHTYPAWRNLPIEEAVQEAIYNYQEVKSKHPDKTLVITETGWPSEGGSLKGAVSSAENAMKYFINTQQWSKSDIETCYFSSFDELWKVGDEGDVGVFWGIWDKDEKLKF